MAMTAKEYLSNIRGNRDLLMQATEDYLEAVARATSISSALGNAGEGRGGVSDLSSKLVSLDYFATKRKKEADRLNASWQKAYEEITALPDARHRSVLTRYYLHGETFEQVAVNLCYSWRQVIRLHGNALRSFDLIHRGWLEKMS